MIDYIEKLTSERNELLNENKELKSYLSEQPRSQTQLPDWAQKLWEDLLNVGDYNGLSSLKRIMAHFEYLEGRVKRAEEAIKKLQFLLGPRSEGWARELLDICDNILENKNEQT